MQSAAFTLHGGLMPATFPFPAWETFDADPRTGPAELRVYRFLRSFLDFTEIREVPAWYVAQNVVGRYGKRLQRQHVSGILDRLVERGYLVEHPRQNSINQARRFTLAWSVRVIVEPRRANEQTADTKPALDVASAQHRRASATRREVSTVGRSAQRA